MTKKILMHALAVLLGLIVGFAACQFIADLINALGYHAK